MAAVGVMGSALHRRLAAFAPSSRTLSALRISPPSTRLWEFSNARFHVRCSTVAPVEDLNSKQSGQVAVFVDLLLEWNQVTMEPFVWFSSFLRFFEILGVCYAPLIHREGRSYGEMAGLPAVVRLLRWILCRGCNGIRSFGWSSQLGQN